MLRGVIHKLSQAFRGGNKGGETANRDKMRCSLHSYVTLLMTAYNSATV